MNCSVTVELITVFTQHTKEKTWQIRNVITLWPYLEIFMQSLLPSFWSSTLNSSRVTRTTAYEQKHIHSSSFFGPTGICTTVQLNSATVVFIHFQNCFGFMVVRSFPIDGSGNTLTFSIYNVRIVTSVHLFSIHKAFPEPEWWHISCNFSPISQLLLTTYSFCFIKMGNFDAFNMQCNMLFHLNCECIPKNNRVP